MDESVEAYTTRNATIRKERVGSKELKRQQKETKQKEWSLLYASWKSNADSVQKEERKKKIVMRGEAGSSFKNRPPPRPKSTGVQDPKWGKRQNPCVSKVHRRQRQRKQAKTKKSTGDGRKQPDDDSNNNNNNNNISNNINITNNNKTRTQREKNQLRILAAIASSNAQIKEAQIRRDQQADPAKSLLKWANRNINYTKKLDAAARKQLEARLLEGDGSAQVRTRRRRKSERGRIKWQVFPSQDKGLVRNRNKKKWRRVRRLDKAVARTSAARARAARAAAKKHIPACHKAYSAVGADSVGSAGAVLPKPAVGCAGAGTCGGAQDQHQRSRASGAALVEPTKLRSESGGTGSAIICICMCGLRRLQLQNGKSQLRKASMAARKKFHAELVARTSPATVWSIGCVPCGAVVRRFCLCSCVMSPERRGAEVLVGPDRVVDNTATTAATSTTAATAATAATTTTTAFVTTSSGF